MEREGHIMNIEANDGYVERIVMDEYGNYATIKSQEWIRGQIVYTLDKNYQIKRIPTKVTTIKDKD